MCVVWGGRERKTGRLYFFPIHFTFLNPVRSSIRPGSLAVIQHLGPDHPPLPLSLPLPTLAFSPFTDATPLSLPPPSSHPSLSFHLPPIILFYTIPLTSDPRHHPNLSKKTVPSFPSPLYFSPFRVRARLSSLHTLIETFNAAPLRRGPPLIVSLPSPPNTLVPQQTTDRPTEPNLRLTTCPAH